MAFQIILNGVFTNICMYVQGIIHGNLVMNSWIQDLLVSGTWGHLGALWPLFIRVRHRVCGSVFTCTWVPRSWCHKQIKLWWRLCAFCLSLRDKRPSDTHTPARVHAHTHAYAHHPHPAVCIHHMSGRKCSVTKGEFIPGFHCKYNGE